MTFNRRPECRAVPIPKIIPFVEGHGDTQALPILIRRILHDTVAEKLASNPVHIPDAWRVGHQHKLLASGGAEWIRLLNAVARDGASAVLLVLDGDRLGTQCPGDAARSLAASAKNCGAGARFSVGVVFAMQEMESWFIADAEALIGSGTSHAGRRGKKIPFPDGDLEKIPRDAKRWLSENMPGGYKPTIHQSDFARLLNIQKVRSHNLRSFRRFEHAVTDLFNAAISGPHIASP